MDIAGRLCEIVASGRAGRQVATLCRKEDLLRAADILERARKVCVVTGFFVPAADAPETDGPPGAAVLARALGHLGKESRTITDRPNLKALEACCSVLGIEAPLQAASPEDILSLAPDVLVFAERVGRVEDGRYYNMRGEDITAWTAPLDGAADRAAEKGIPLVAIGDGGNEAGMGCLKGKLEALLPSFSCCLCRVKADVAVPVDVSNWGAYALTGMLSVRARKWLGHEPEEEGAMLEAMVARGAVDGVSCQKTPSVDGMPAEVHAAVVARIKALCMEHIPQRDVSEPCR
ncbi:MAG: DUF4392 domain-containing protein [Thermovirgaceae bacterium]